MEDSEGACALSAIEMVFFDAGETLLRPYPSFPELFAHTVGKHGHDVSPAEVEALQERLAPHLVELLEESGVEKPSLSAEASFTFWTHLYRRLLGELNLDEGLTEVLYGVFSDSSSYKLFDDVLPTLKRLEELGYRIGLISNFEGWLEKMLVELEIGHVFDVSVISGLEGMEKPDPAIYELAVERSGVAPERSVHIGDSPKMDVEPAHSVGIRPILLDRRNRYPMETFPRIRSLEELPDLIPQLD